MNEDLEKLQSVYNQIIEFSVAYSFQILGAIIILTAGAWIATKVGKLIENIMVNRKIDITLSRFSGGVIKLVILAMVAIIALGNLGISITPFLAAIGALGLGVGLAVQGMLSNYVAGFTIILTRPFVVGDTIQVQDVAGLVDQVHLGYTILIDEDNVRIQIPNRLIIGEILHNSNAEMLIELEIGVAYHTDTTETIELIAHALKQIEAINHNRNPTVGIDHFGDSSINFGVRFWAPTTKHYEIRYAANKAIHDAIIAANIEIPFPQREINIISKA